MKHEIGSAFTGVGSDTDERYHFVAALFAVGFDLADGTPGITHVYSSKNKYERGQTGDIRYIFAAQFRGININAFVDTWKNPEQALRDAEGLPARIKTTATGKELLKLSQRFELLYLQAAVGHMRLASLSRIDCTGFSAEPNSVESTATDYLDTVAQRIESAVTPKQRDAIAKAVVKHWRPAMVSWLKAYRGHLLELRNLWKEAPESIKIDTGDRFPIIIPKGPKFKQLLNRWT